MHDQVQSKYQSTCDKCDKIRRKRWKEKCVYFLETHKFKVKY